MRKSRRVIIITESYPPILNSAGRLFSELAEYLCQKDFDVVVLTEKPSRYTADNSSQKEKRKTSTSNPRVIRLPGFPRLRSVLVFRYIEQLLKMIMYFFVGLFYSVRRDVIIYSPPLPLAVAGILISKLYRRRSIANVQDLYPETAIALGVMKNSFLIAISRMMERWIYRHADSITVHSNGNKDYVIGHGAPRDKVHVVYNWVDLEKYSPGPLNDGFRATYKIGDKFIVSYAGVIGLAQGVESLLNAAQDFRRNSKVHFVLAGGGLGYRAIREQAEKEGLDNILFLPHLAEHEYVKLLRSSNICLVTLVKELKTPVVPGKLQSIMAVGRPVICSIPSVSDAKTMIKEANCGLWVDPGDKTGLSKAIQELLQNDSREDIGKHGREYAKRFFEKKACTQTYLNLLLKQ